MNTEHGTDEVGAGEAWQELAEHARVFAEQVTYVAALPPFERISSNGGAANELSQLEANERALRSLLSSARQQTYEQLRAEGWSVQQIADELGSSYQAVRKVLQRSNP